MDSESQRTTSTQCQASNRHLECHTDPRSSGTNKTSKRSWRSHTPSDYSSSSASTGSTYSSGDSEESFERPSKRRSTSYSPSDYSSFSSTRAQADSSSSASTSSSDNRRSCAINLKRRRRAYGKGLIFSDYGSQSSSLSSSSASSGTSFTTGNSEESFGRCKRKYGACLFFSGHSSLSSPRAQAASSSSASTGSSYSTGDSEESFERPRKRRTSDSPSQHSSQVSSWSSSSDHTGSSASSSTGSSDSTGETSSLSGSDESEERLRKRARWIPSSDEGHDKNFCSSSSTEDAGTTMPSIFCRKRKCEESEENRRKRRKISHCQKATFWEKYEEWELLGKGGFGSVFAGYRSDDNLPVAIKHIIKDGISNYTWMVLDGKITTVPLEVALLLQVKPAAGTGAAIALLDWYDLEKELILVLERPVPCADLIEYIEAKGSHLQEHEAKIITKQLVDALMEVHSRGVFHRDIKLENILIDTDSDVPQARIIDFGCGTFLSERTYTTIQGTYIYTSPEWFLEGRYRAEPITVWQLGVVLFSILHGHLPFKSSREIVHENPEVKEGLSFDCQGFLQSCLTKSPDARPTLETLKNHPWLILTETPRTT